MKRKARRRVLSLRASHPVRVRGLKPLQLLIHQGRGQSHPVRVRGLKLKWKYLEIKTKQVAPRAGAWVETSYI